MKVWGDMELKFKELKIADNSHTYHVPKEIR
jgi:hypothetical protein